MHSTSQVYRWQLPIYLLFALTPLRTRTIIANFPLEYFNDRAEAQVKMTSADVRDMLNLNDDDNPRPVKKQKTVEKRPEGIPRELFALLGERAAPVAITDRIRYRERPKVSQKTLPWYVLYKRHYCAVVVWY